MVEDSSCRKEIGPRLASVCSETCCRSYLLLLLLWQNRYNFTKKRGNAKEEKRKGKNVSHVKNEAADWRNGFVSSTFFCLWRETNDLKVTSLLSHVWKRRNFCTQPLRCVVGRATFCKSHMGNVYYFALNRSRYCVAVHKYFTKERKKRG